MRGSLVTPRLRLDAFVPSDAAELHPLFADPLTNTVGAGPYTEIEQTERWIRNRIAFQKSNGLCWYAIRDHATGTLIGNCGMLAGRTGAAEPEIGYLISAAHRGRGYASEAARAVLAECRTTDLTRIWASIRPHNTASRRIVSALGLRLDHTERDERGELDFWILDLTHPAVDNAAAL